MTNTPKGRLRSPDWCDNPDHADMTALYLKRFMNLGITPEELRTGRPIIGSAQSGSDLPPCNRHHLELAKCVRDGIRDAHGSPSEFPIHPIFQNCRRPTAALDCNLASLRLVVILFGYPLDGVMWTRRCDNTAPAAMMAALDIPLLADTQPAGRFLGDRFPLEGGVPAIMAELLAAGKLDGGAQNLAGRLSTDRALFRPEATPLKQRAGFRVLRGNLFDFAIMKTSVISGRGSCRVPGPIMCLRAAAPCSTGPRITSPASTTALWPWTKPASWSFAALAPWVGRDRPRW